MNRIFDNVKDELVELLGANIKLELGSHTVKNIVRELEGYSFIETREDVLGVAFETFLRGTMTGRELGEFFTPREVVDFMVKVVAPSIDERVLDPACGSGGFLLHSFSSIATSLSTDPRRDQKIAQYIENCLWGVDINEYLVQLCKINLKIQGDGFKHIYRCDSLNIQSFPDLWHKIKNQLYPVRSL